MIDIILKIPLASRPAVDATFKSSHGQFYQVIIIIISVIWIINIPMIYNTIISIRFTGLATIQEILLQVCLTLKGP